MSVNKDFTKFNTIKGAKQCEITKEKKVKMGEWEVDSKKKKKISFAVVKVSLNYTTDWLKFVIKNCT